MAEDNGVLRKFKSGANRDTAEGKIDPEGFFDPLVITAFSEFMHEHRKQTDGNLRDSDNWQNGFTRASIMKSMWRHLLDVWRMHRGHPPFSSDHAEIWKTNPKKALVHALCGVYFNAAAYMREILLGRDNSE